jgi:hypothetical protein
VYLPGAGRAAFEKKLYSGGKKPKLARFSTDFTMGNLRKKRRRKIAQHKRSKRSRANRHKKRTWG